MTRIPSQSCSKIVCHASWNRTDRSLMLSRLNSSNFVRRMAIFFGGYFVVTGIGIPFLPIWLSARGLSDTQIALCLAFPMAARIVFTPLASAFANRAKTRQFAVRVLLLAAVVTFSLADLEISDTVLILLTGSAFTLWGLALPIAEAIALTGVRRFDLNYGRMRLGGSISFIASNLVSGAALGVLSHLGIFWLLASGIIIAATAAFVLPPAHPVKVFTVQPQASSFRRMLGHPAFLALLSAGALIQASHAALYGFASIDWQSRGFSAAEIGCLWAIGVIGEIMLFAFSSRATQRLGLSGLLAAGAVAAILRWSLFPIDLGFFGFLAAQLLHALTFGSSYLGIQSVITRMVSDELTASAQGLYVMLANLAMAATTALSGPLYNAYGRSAFYAMIVPALAALVLLLRYRKQVRPSNG
jgi:PPP family 3-phenylpropionic acid transporter